MFTENQIINYIHKNFNDICPYCNNTIVRLPKENAENILSKEKEKSEQ